MKTEVAFGGEALRGGVLSFRNYWTGSGCSGGFVRIEDPEQEWRKRCDGLDRN